MTLTAASRPPTRAWPLVPLLARTGLILVPWALIVVAWYAVRLSGLVSPALVPAPHQVFAKFIELLGDRLLMDMWMSTQRVFVGVALGVAWATLVASELIAAQQGLGAMIQNASAFFQLDIIYVGIICIGFIALAMDVALRALTRRMVAWQDRIA